MFLRNIVRHFGRTSTDGTVVLPLSSIIRFKNKWWYMVYLKQSDKETKNVLIIEP